MGSETNTDNESGGLLTPPQREYLRGNTDIDPGSNHDRVTRSRIRNRLHAALTLDIDILATHLSADDWDQVTDSLSPSVTSSLITLVSWIHQIATAIGADTDAILARGIEHAETQLGNGDATVTVDLEITRGIDPLVDRFNDGDPTLTGADIARLHLENAIDSDDLTDYYNTLSNQSPPPKISTNVIDPSDSETIDPDNPAE